MRARVDTEELKRALDLLIGKPLRAAVVTRDDQSSLLLDLGRKIARGDKRPETAESEGEADEKGRVVRLFARGEDSATSELRRYRGEWALLVCCNWRAERGESQILCGSQDSLDEEGAMLGGLQQIVGSTVTEVSLNSFLDLVLAFDGGKRLRLFCDESVHEDRDDSYRLYTPDRRMYGVITGLIEVQQIPRQR